MVNIILPFGPVVLIQTYIYYICFPDPYVKPSPLTSPPGGGSGIRRKGGLVGPVISSLKLIILPSGLVVHDQYNSYVVLIQTQIYSTCFPDPNVKPSPFGPGILWTMVNIILPSGHVVLIQTQIYYTCFPDPYVKPSPPHFAPRRG